MKAATVTPGSPVSYSDFPDPEPQAGRQIVELVAAGIHPVVRSIAAGRHYSSSTTERFVPGVDGVARTADGRTVYTGFTLPPYGTMAERISVPDRIGFTLPAGADPAVVAGSMNPGLATWLPLQHLAGSAAEASVLITGATGSAGRLAVQNARILGVPRIIVAGRDAEQLARLETLGATGTLVLSGDHDADVEAATAVFAGGVPTLVLDLVWGWVAEAVLAAMVSHRLDGQPAATRYVHIGATGGATAAVPGAALRSRPIEIVGSGAGAASIPAMIEQIPVYLDLIASGQLVSQVRTFDLSDVAGAWAPERTGVRHVLTASDRH